VQKTGKFCYIEIGLSYEFDESVFVILSVYIE